MAARDNSAAPRSILSEIAHLLMAEPKRLPDRHIAGWLDVATSDANDAARIQRQWKGASGAG